MTSSAPSFTKHLIAECIAWRFLCRIVSKSRETCREQGSISFTPLSKIEPIFTKLINAQRNCMEMFYSELYPNRSKNLKGEGAGEISPTQINWLCCTYLMKLIHGELHHVEIYTKFYQNPSRSMEITHLYLK